jgi:hypothetical protein
MRAARKAAREAVTDRTVRIGTVAPAPEGTGYDALDVDGNLVETFETIVAARRALFDLHRGGHRE